MRIKLNLKPNEEEDPEDLETIDLMLNVKSFEELRFCVAKSLSLTNSYKVQ